MDTYLGTKDSIIIGLALFSTLAEIAEEAEKHNLNDEEKQLVTRYKKKVSSIQVGAFPRLRDAYGPAARKALWEDDISVRTIGKGFRVIEFVGHVFAANRNIKQFQLGVWDFLHQMRFKQARYKGYKEADKYTYYDMEPHKDSDLVVWTAAGRSRVVPMN